MEGKLSYTEKNLMEGEKIIYTAHLHWIIYLGPIILSVISLILLPAIVMHVILPSIVMHVWEVLIVLLFAGIWWLKVFIKQKTSEYAVTNRRVLVKIGFLSVSSVEILLTKIESILVNQDLWGQIFNYGTIIVKGTGGTQDPFFLIAAPLEFRKKVQEQVGLI
jgi:uncharacterized membrane protein YdbT with pleckstrin-like domain